MPIEESVFEWGQDLAGTTRIGLMSEGIGGIVSHSEEGGKYDAKAVRSGASAWWPVLCVAEVIWSRWLPAVNSEVVFALGLFGLFCFAVSGRDWFPQEPR